MVLRRNPPPLHLRHRKSGHSFGNAVTGDAAAVTVGLHLGAFGGAAGIGLRATRVEGAAGGWFHRAWHLARLHRAVALGIGDVRDRFEQKLGVGVLGLANSTSVAACSTIRPRYITAI